MRVVKDETTMMVAMDRILTVHMKNVPTATQSVIHVGDEAPMFGGKLVAKWVHLYCVTYSNCTMLELETGGRLINRVERYVDRRDPRQNNFTFDQLKATDKNLNSLTATS